MRQQTAQSVGSGMEIALRDQKQINKEFMLGEFPLESGNRTSSSLVRDGRKFDSAAYSGGRAAGDKANISVNPSKGLKDRRSLGK